MPDVAPQLLAMHVLHMKNVRADGNMPGRCLTCSLHWESRCGGDVHPTEDRYFSILECMRIQTLHDSFILCGSLSDMYHLVGNAVPALLVEKVAMEIKKAVQKSGS